MHMIIAVNKKRLSKFLHKFFPNKQLSHSHLQELYEFIDQGFTTEDFQKFTSESAREPTTNLLQNQLRKLLNELEATSQTVKPVEEDPLSRETNEADPNVSSSSQPQASLEGSTAAEDEDIPDTSESKTSSGSSLDDASELIIFTYF